MPSTKVPNTAVVVGGGPLPPGGFGGGSVGASLEAHIEDPVGAHAASAISYAGGGAWADGTTNPASDVETEVDKIISDLTATGGSTGAGKVYKGISPAWEDGSTIAAGDLNTWLNTLVSTLASSTIGNTGAEKIGTQVHTSTFGSWTTGGDGVSVDMSDLLNAINYGLYSYVVVNGGNSPFTLNFGGFWALLLVESSASRTIILPQTPANYAGMRWYIYDTTGSSEVNAITIQRYAAATYTVNGYAGNITVGKRFGQWVITCNGTNFFVEEVQAPKQLPATVISTNEPYTLDATIRNDLLLVDSSLATPGARRIVLPQTPADHKGQRWYFIDVSGTSGTYNIIVYRYSGATYTINGYAGNASVGNDFGQWMISCDGVNFYVHEITKAIHPPVTVNGGNSPYTLDADGFQNDEVYVDTGAARTIILPQTPARHKGQRWVVHDQAGTCESFNIVIQRYAAATYTINGYAGNTYLSANYGRWVISCDGINFFVN